MDRLMRFAFGRAEVTGCGEVMIGDPTQQAMGGAPFTSHRQGAGHFVIGPHAVGWVAERTIGPLLGQDPINAAPGTPAHLLKNGGKFGRFRGDCSHLHLL